MTQPRPDLPMPGPEALLDEALQGLAVGLQECRCPSRYHALWGLLKAVGVHRGLHTEWPALAAVLQPLLAAGGHVLIAGTADTTGLHLLSTCAGTAKVRFTVADQCPAPLRRVESHAASCGLNLQTRQGDLANLLPEDPWDLAFLHYTLSFADGGARRRILGALAQGLAPGGRVVCVAKFASGLAEATPSNQAEAWLESLRPRVVQLLTIHPEALAVAEAHLSASAVERSARNVSQPSEAELQGDFETAGLRIHTRLATPRKEWAASRANPTAERGHSVILVAARQDGL